MDKIILLARRHKPRNSFTFFICLRDGSDLLLRYLKMTYSLRLCDIVSDCVFVLILSRCSDYCSTTLKGWPWERLSQVLVDIFFGCYFFLLVLGWYGSISYSINVLKLFIKTFAFLNLPHIRFSVLLTLLLAFIEPDAAISIIIYSARRLHFHGLTHSILKLILSKAVLLGDQNP